MMRSLGILTLFLFLVLHSTAQQTYKESKLFSKSYDYKEGETVRITGERTFITIHLWQENKVQAEVEVISRSNDQDQAKTDLDKVKVNFQKKGKTVYYNNALRIKSDKDKPKSNLKTILNLYVPAYAVMNITSSFGEVLMEGSVTELILTSQFSSALIENHNGKLEIESKYDKIKCINTKGSLKFRGNRTDLTLNRSSGDLQVLLDYGNLDITHFDPIEKMEVIAYHSPITLIVPSDSDATIEVRCNSCDINVDNCNRISKEDISKNKHTVRLGTEKKAKTNIKSGQGDVTIITTNSITTTN